MLGDKWVCYLGKLAHTRADFELFAEIRSTKNLKAFDSLQVATALRCGCDFFITGDKTIVKRLSGMVAVDFHEFVEYVCDAMDWMLKEGEHCARMLSVGLHLRMIGRAARMGALHTILQHASSKAVWVATREQIAQHWVAESV